MSYTITTIDYHEKAKAKDSADNLRRRDLDVYDCALSSWASDQMIGFHSVAISALNAGLERA